MEELFSHPASGFALLGLLLLIGAGLYLRRVKLTTRIIIHIAMMLALSIILQQLRLFHLPQGGAVTLGAMVPLLLLSWRYGPGIGALSGFLYGMINLLLDPFILHPVQVLFDYPLPLMAMGLAGLFPKRIYLAAALAFTGRFLCHFISGIVFFGSYAPEGMSPAIYSLTLNGSFMLAEFLICCIVLRFLPVQRLLAAMQGEH